MEDAADDGDVLDQETNVPTVPADLLAELERWSGTRGYHKVLDADHTATLIARGGTLIVSFQEIDATLERETGLPIALDLAEDKNWSVLHITAARPTWFRAEAVFAFFDTLADQAFFDEYDRVIFFGAGAGGYAAAAYSVTAPGARVVVIEPQATLDTRIAEWDTRFPRARRRSFTGRYAYAPEMVVAAEEVVLIYDPQKAVDAMHATLFQGANITPIRLAHHSFPEVESLADALESLDVLHTLIEGLGSGRIGRTQVYKLMRKRHEDMNWIRRLISRLGPLDRPRLLAIVCKAGIKRGGGQLFRRRLKGAADILEERGETPDWLED